MKELFDQVSYECSKKVTEKYSTSFSLATRMLGKVIRQDIYNIYGFVRFADEIVDSFHEFNKEDLFTSFKIDLEKALSDRISLNPILNSFQHTVHKYGIGRDLIADFMYSMELDLTKQSYTTTEEYENYIHGSANVVGLMCLKVFVKGNQEQYDELKESAMKLGSAFQKVNFLRDLKADMDELNRTYFPNANLEHLNEHSKKAIIDDIERDFKTAYQGIKKLPIEAKFGVFTAYRYYKQLLKKLNNVPAKEIKRTRIRIPDYKKIEILTRSYVKYQLNLL